MHVHIQLAETRTNTGYSAPSVSDDNRVVQCTVLRSLNISWFIAMATLINFYKSQ